MASCEVQQISGYGDNRESCSGFSLSNVSKAFAKCFDGSDVNLNNYTEAYNELVRQVPSQLVYLIMAWLA